MLTKDTSYPALVLALESLHTSSLRRLWELLIVDDEELNNERSLARSSTQLGERTYSQERLDDALARRERASV